MQLDTINSFSTFCTSLRKAGFAMGGGNDNGIFSLFPFMTKDIEWHTGNPETDPWEWRIRVLNECNDIAYGKLFFNKTGYITKEWYPYFLRCRRNGKTFEEAYRDGTVSSAAKRIYEQISEYGALPLHEIKKLAGFSKEENSRFERAIVELQMRMFIAMCGSARKVSRAGEEYGWNVTMFCPAERFFGQQVFDEASKLKRDEATEKIRSRIIELNPNADEKLILKIYRNPLTRF